MANNPLYNHLMAQQASQNALEQNYAHLINNFKNQWGNYLNEEYKYSPAQEAALIEQRNMMLHQKQMELEKQQKACAGLMQGQQLQNAVGSDSYYENLFQQMKNLSPIDSPTAPPPVEKVEKPQTTGKRILDL